MKIIHHIIILSTLIFTNILPLKAQTTVGKEFWLTYGQALHYDNPSYFSMINMQIRIVAGNLPTSTTIYFTHLDVSESFNINAYEVYTYSLDNTQKAAVYNITTGITTDYSIHITTSEPVSIYALIYAGIGDVTNALPVTSLGTKYYHCSYIQNSNPSWAYMDAYAVVATKNNTHLYHDGDLAAILNIGEVYYTTTPTDMTGSLITANNPVAFFALHQGAHIPFGVTPETRSPLMQQLSPVITWDKAFFVPVTVMGEEIVRIVASQDNTDITTLIGGTIRTGVPGARETLTDLQAGEFVELEIFNTGCYIEANNPIGVCSYMIRKTLPPNVFSIPAQTWIPGIKQTASNVLIAPFVNFVLQSAMHYALIISPTATRDNTKVSIGGAPSTNLSGGSWIENDTAKMSFYSMPLTDATNSYLFSNPHGIIILGYAVGAGIYTSYYYLAGSSMRNMSATFTANNIPYYEMFGNMFCENDITLVADIEGIHPSAGSLKWYIDNVPQPQLTDLLTWNQNFATGNYEIKMEVRFEDNSTETYEGTLKVGCGVAFYANNVYYDTLYKTTFCAKNVNFRAEIEGDLHADEGRIKWFIDGVEYVPARDSLEWGKSFETNNYEIKMMALFANGEAATLVATLKIEILWIKIRNIRTH